MRDNIKLEGRLVMLEEISPRFFPYVIKWRNDPNLNRYLNQNFKLTLEKERDWYENFYLPNENQGLLVGIDRESEKPFGTFGWTDLDLQKRRCCIGRLLVADSHQHIMQMFEMAFLLCDYLYQFADEIFSQVVRENSPSIRFNKSLGFVENFGEIQFPQYATINGMNIIELRCTRDQFEKAKSKISRMFSNIFGEEDSDATQTRRKTGDAGRDRAEIFSVRNQVEKRSKPQPISQSTFRSHAGEGTGLVRESVSEVTGGGGDKVTSSESSEKPEDRLER